MCQSDDELSFPFPPAAANPTEHLKRLLAEKHLIDSFHREPRRYYLVDNGEEIEVSWEEFCAAVNWGPDA